MYNRLFTCCKNCTERHSGCHSKCEPYLADKAKVNKLREKHEADRDYRAYDFERRQDSFDTYVRKRIERRNFRMKRK